MRCDICRTNKELISDKIKAQDRPNWAGVDFYSAICAQCWEVEKARR